MRSCRASYDCSPGEKRFVDWAGDTIALIDPATGTAASLLNASAKTDASQPISTE
jgi:hypothetical protein